VPLGIQTLIGLIGLLSLAVVSGLAALGLVLHLAGDQDQVTEHAVPYASWVATAALDAKGVANDERGFLLTGDPTFIEEADQRIADARSAFGAAAAAATDAGEVDAVRGATATFERWVAEVRAEFDGYLAGDRTDAVTSALGANRDTRKEYEQALAQAQALGDRAIATAQQSVNRTSNWSIAILAAIVVIGIVIGIAVIAWLMRTIALPVYRLVALLTPDAA